MFKGENNILQAHTPRKKKSVWIKGLKKNIYAHTKSPTPPPAQK